jgi:hypothetical protein
MKSLRFPIIWLPASMISGWIECMIPWGKSTGFHGTGMPIPMVLWDKPNGRQDFLAYPNPLAVVENPLLVFLVGILFWGLYSCARFLVVRRASGKARNSD